MKLNNQKQLIFFGLVLAGVLGWQKLYLEPRAKQQAALEQAGTAAVNQTLAPAIEAKPVQSQALDLQLGQASVGSGAQFFSGWKLNGYKKKNLNQVDLASVTELEQPGGLQLSFDSPELAYLSGAAGELSGSHWKYEDSNILLTREFQSSANQPYVNVVIRAQFKKQTPKHVFVWMQGKINPDTETGEDRAIVYYSQKEASQIALKELPKLTEAAAPVKWVGLTGRYFLFSWMNETKSEPSLNTDPWALVQPMGADQARVSMVYPIHGNSIEIKGKALFVPKELTLLRSIDPTLDHTVDFGFFTIFAYPLLKFLKWLFSFTGNYGVAIILLTLALKIVTYPLTYKSVKAMKQMSKIQPQLEKLKEKYKDDKETLNKEMLGMMKNQGYNPMAGCLPVLAQIPVFFALNRVLYVAIELYQAPFAFWVHDLSAKDPYYVTPVLLSVIMFIQQKMMPNTATDPMQAKMIQFMPLIFGIFMLTLPSGLTLYMLVNALAGIAQQFILNRKFDTGQVAPIVAKAR